MITCYHVTTWYTYLWSLASSLASRTFFASRALRVLRFSYIKSKQNSFKRHHKVTKFLKKSSFSPLRSLHEHHPTVFPSLRSKAVKKFTLAEHVHPIKYQFYSVCETCALYLRSELCSWPYFRFPQFLVLFGLSLMLGSRERLRLENRHKKQLSL